jgi:hypothetical protein
VAVVARVDRLERPSALFGPDLILLDLDLPQDRAVDRALLAHRRQAPARAATAADARMA